MTCPYCPANACRGCIQRYLLSSHEDPQCIGCRKGWNREFIDLHLTKTFRNGPLRKHRAKTLMDREKAMLPAMQIFVEATKDLRKAGEEFTTVNAVLRKYEIRRIEVLRNRDVLHARIRNALPDTEEAAAALAALDANCENYGQNEARAMRVRYDIEVINRRINRSHNILEGRAENDNRVVEKREFIQHCPAEGCRGYLSTAYKCGVCAKYTCSDCLVVKGENRDAPHTCNEEAKASAALIQRETRPCPKCGVRIFKIDGCDQMFCTQDTCHTAFSWNTGHIITGKIHNPHYYEYLRHANGGVAPREAGDVPCGGLPVLYQFTQNIMATDLPQDTKNLILHIHRTLNDLIEVRLADYPAQRAANSNKDINIRYLMNEMDEATWQKTLEQRESKFEKKREIGQILTTFAHVGAEFMRQLVPNPILTVKDRATFVKRTWTEVTAKQMNDLRVYTNKSLKELGERMLCAFPQVDKDWDYIPPRKIGVDETKPSPSEEAAAQRAARAAPVAAPVAPVARAPVRNRFTAGDYADDGAVVVE